MKYLILDEETEIHASFKRKANPFDPRNFIVFRGWKKEGDARCSAERFATKQIADQNGLTDEFLADVDVIVAHNAKFEMHWEMMTGQGREVLMRFFARGGRLWCTQLAEYLLRAQERKYHMCSLDGIIESYGGRKKIDGMKELWDQGIHTSQIDPDFVLDYLIGTEAEGRNSGDIGNTELVYKGQLELAKEFGMLKAIELRMDSLLGTSEMEFNGIHVNTAVAMRNYQELDKELQTATEKLAEWIKDIPAEVEFKWTSPVCKSAILFGGTIRYQKQDTYIDEKTGELARFVETHKWPLFDKEPVDPSECEPVNPDEYAEGLCLKLRRKSDGKVQDCNLGGKNKGAPKFRNVKGWGELKVKYQDFFYELPGYCDPKELGIENTKTTDGRGKKLFKTDSDTIELLGNSDIPFLADMGRKAALDKEIGTYYIKIDDKGEKKGMLTCLNPADNIVHHKLNHTSTVTTRLSASDPNMQNIPRKDKSKVKEMFTSRFGDDGYMAELDYSQLEVVVQGFLSGDKALINDLINRVDFHCKRVAIREGVTYEEALEWCKNEDHVKYAVWSVFRTECKIFSFQRAYGAGASTIALTAGMTTDAVKDMMTKEDAMYPGVVKFNDSVQREVEATAEAFRDPERGYRTFRRGTWQGPTGTMYTWRSWDAPKFLKDQGVMDSFSPPELKNYPTQGTGGEFVQMVIGQLFRFFMMKNNWDGKALLVNTVHDCIWLDIHKDVVNEVVPVVHQIMEAIPQMLKKFFDLDCPVPFPVDAEIGRDMQEMKHFQPIAA